MPPIARLKQPRLGKSLEYWWSPSTIVSWNAVGPDRCRRKITFLNSLRDPTQLIGPSAGIRIATCVLQVSTAAVNLLTLEANETLHRLCGLLVWLTKYRANTFPSCCQRMDMFCWAPRHCQVPSEGGCADNTHYKYGDSTTWAINHLPYTDYTASNCT